MVKDFSDSAAEEYGSNLKYQTPKTKKLQRKKDYNNEINMPGIEDHNGNWATQPVSIDPMNRSPD